MIQKMSYPVTRWWQNLRREAAVYCDPEELASFPTLELVRSTHALGGFEACWELVLVWGRAHRVVCDDRWVAYRGWAGVPVGDSVPTWARR